MIYMKLSKLWKKLFTTIQHPKIMTCDPFTNEELDKLYDLVRTQHEEVMCGDLQAVKTDIADLHVLMSKLIYAQRKHND